MTGLELVALILTGLASVVFLTVVVKLAIAIKKDKKEIYDAWKKYAAKELENDRLDALKKNANDPDVVPTLSEIKQISGVLWPFKILYHLPKTKWKAAFNLMGRDFARHFAASYRIVFGPFIDGLLRAVGATSLLLVNATISSYRPIAGSVANFTALIRQLDVLPSVDVNISNGSLVNAEDFESSVGALKSGYKLSAMYRKFVPGQRKMAENGLDFIILSKALAVLQGMDKSVGLEDKQEKLKELLGEKKYNSLITIENDKHVNNLIDYLKYGYLINSKNIGSKKSPINVLLADSSAVAELKTRLFLEVTTNETRKEIFTSVASKGELFDKIKNSYRIALGEFDVKNNCFVDGFNRRLGKLNIKTEIERKQKLLKQFLRVDNKDNLLSQIEDAVVSENEDKVFTEDSRSKRDILLSAPLMRKLLNEVANDNNFTPAFKGVKNPDNIVEKRAIYKKLAQVALDKRQSQSEKLAPSA